MLAAKAQIREGILASATFPALLYSILRRTDTGVLTLTGDTTEKSIYVQDGRPIFATSNDRDDRLGQVLFKTGQVSLDGLMNAVEISVKSGKRLGTVLVEQGLIQPHELVEGVGVQVRSIIHSLFVWTRGRYRYSPGPLPTDEVITLKLSPGDLILEGIRTIESWGRIWEAVGPLEATYRTTERLESLVKDMTLSLEEWSLLSHCEQPVPLKELCRLSPVADFEICRFLWAALTLGVVKRDSGGA
jgi:two-component system OmpR family response regulator